MRKLPPLAQLRAFEAAARQLSFKKAAAELAVTPTAISHQIRLLEQYCGQSLFRRRPRPVVLTKVGARLYPVIRNGLDTFANAVSAVREESERTPLKVTTTNAFASRWLLPRLTLWQQAHPGIALEVIGSDYVVDLRAGEADLAVRYARTAPSDLVAYELFRDRYIPVCKPALLSRHKSIRRAADLARFVLIDNAWSSSFANVPTWGRLLEKAQETDPEVPAIADVKIFGFSEETHAIEAAIAGQGIAICSDVLVAHEIESGTLVKVLDLSLRGAGFFLAHLPNHPRQPMIDAFWHWMRSMRQAGQAR